MKKKINLLNILTWLLIIMPFIDVITALTTRFTDFSITIGMVIKGLLVVFSVIYVFFLSKSKYKKVSSIYFISLFLYFTFFLLFKRDIWSFKMLFTEGMYAFKYFFFLFIFVGFLNIFDDLKIEKKEIKRILLINAIMYAFLMLIPIVTGTAFNSYNYSGIFGYNGWFYAANETGIITLVLTISCYDMLKSNKKLYYIFAILLVLSISMIGTKTSYLGLIILIVLTVLLYIFNDRKSTLKKEYIIKIFFMCLVLLVLCTFSTASSNITNFFNSAKQATTESKKNTESTMDGVLVKDKKILSAYGIYKDVTDIVKNDTTLKLVKFTFHGREQFFVNNYAVFKQSGIKNILFGLGWSDRESIHYTINKKNMEIDVTDILIHYGIVGFILYYGLIVGFIFITLKEIIKSKFKNYLLMYYFLILMMVLVISSVAGHALAAPAVSLYFVLLMLLIKCEYKRS